MASEGMGLAAGVTETAAAAHDWRRFVAPALVCGAVGAILLAGGLSTPEFLNVDNILIIVRAASITGIVALGMTFVTISGNFFSLSVEQTAALSSIVFAEALSHGFGLAAALVLALS